MPIHILQAIQLCHCTIHSQSVDIHVNKQPFIDVANLIFFYRITMFTTLWLYFAFKTFTGILYCRKLNLAGAAMEVIAVLSTEALLLIRYDIEFLVFFCIYC